MRALQGFIFFIGWLVYPFLVEAAYWVLCPRRLHEFTQLLGDRLPLVYRESYNITAGGLESLHPFDSQKYRRGERALSRVCVLSHVYVFPFACDSDCLCGFLHYV